MVIARATANFLPKIKCSNCGVDVELSRMGDHLCLGTSQDTTSQKPGASNNAMAGSRQRSASRPGGPPLRVDSNVANQPFVRPHELTPASSGNMSPRSGYSGHRLRNPPAGLAQRPPSPEYSNLDCAFPPFPITTQRSATPVNEPRGLDPRFNTDFVRKLADPHGQSQVASPTFSSHSRAPSFGSTKSRRRADPNSRPSMASGGRKPSLADISRGPRPMPPPPPPLPTIDLMQQRPSSPSRTQTFPLHNRDRISGTGPNSFIARRPSAPSPNMSARKSVPAADVDTLNALLGRESPPRNKRISTATAPPSSQPRSSPPRAAAPKPLFPTRSASRSETNLPMPSSAPPPLPSTIVPNQYTQDSRPGLDRSPLPPPSKPAVSAMPPESPTDPLCHQGRLSPIPRGALTGSPLSISSSSSSSSTRSSSRNQSGDSVRRGQTGGSKGICRGCNKTIRLGEKSISSRDGQLSGRYHKACFVCHTCRGPFATADFYVHNDRPFCSQHYHAQNGSLCSRCGNGIEGQYLAASTLTGKTAEKFHPSCLKCTTCKISLQDDYFDWMGKVYCERDAKQVANLQNRTPSPSPGPSPRGRPGGLPAGPRATLKAGPGSFTNSQCSPSPLSLDPNGLRPTPGVRRFPERRTTKLMMI